MMKRGYFRVALLLAAVAVAGFRGSLAASEARLLAPSICTLDTAFSNFTLDQIESRLDPSDTTSAAASYRSTYGLTSATFAGIVVVTDSTKCASGIVAYANIKHPSDTMKRNALLAQLDHIFIVQLTPNRFVMNAAVYSRQTMLEHFLVDSTFALVSANF